MNHLRQKEIFELGNWLLNTYEIIKLENWTKIKAAEMASDQLCFDVTHGNISGFTSGDNPLFTWPNRQHQKAVDNDSLFELHKRIDDLCDSVRAVEKDIAWLMANTECPPR